MSEQLSEQGNENARRVRRPIRMCVHCQRMTSDPVLVHEEHAATGPGFSVYACPECAAHYPPPTDALEWFRPADPLRPTEKPLCGPPAPGRQEP